MQAGKKQNQNPRRRFNHRWHGSVFFLALVGCVQRVRFHSSREGRLLEASAVARESFYKARHGTPFCHSIGWVAGIVVPCCAPPAGICFRAIETKKTAFRKRFHEDDTHLSSGRAGKASGFFENHPRLRPKKDTYYRAIRTPSTEPAFCGNPVAGSCRALRFEGMEWLCFCLAVPCRSCFCRRGPRRCIFREIVSVSRDQRLSMGLFL